MVVCGGAPFIQSDPQRIESITTIARRAGNNVAVDGIGNIILFHHLDPLAIVMFEIVRIVDVVEAAFNEELYVGSFKIFIQGAKGIQNPLYRKVTVAVVIAYNMNREGHVQ